MVDAASFSYPARGVALMLATARNFHSAELARVESARVRQIGMSAALALNRSLFSYHSAGFRLRYVPKQSKNDINALWFSCVTPAPGQPADRCRSFAPET